MTEEAISSAQRETVAKTDQIFRAAMQQLTAEVTAGRQFSVAMSLKSGADYDLATTRSGKRPSRCCIWARVSLPITVWKSRTIIG